MAQAADWQVARHADGWLVLGAGLVVMCLCMSMPPRTSGRLPANSSVRLGIDINRADARELTCIPRVGAALAQRIVDYRAHHGPFRSLSDLDQVPGIGPSLLEELAEAILPMEDVAAPRMTDRLSSSLAR